MTREEAIAHGNELLEVFGGEHHEFIKMAILALEQTQWNPVTEKVPRTIGRYLTYIENPHDSQLSCITVCDYLRQRWWPDDKTVGSNNVVAWMPLPNPYKAESEAVE